MRVDVGPPRSCGIELASHLADEHVHRPVPVCHLPSPDERVDLLSGDDAIRSLREHHERLELPYGQANARAVCEQLELRWPDFEVRDAKAVSPGARHAGLFLHNGCDATAPLGGEW